MDHDSALQSRGLAFVSFTKRGAAQAALKLHGTVVDGRKIRVTRAGKMRKSGKDPIKKGLFHAQQDEQRKMKRMSGAARRLALKDPEAFKGEKTSREAAAQQKKGRKRPEKKMQTSNTFRLEKKRKKAIKKKKKSASKKKS